MNAYINGKLIKRALIIWLLIIPLAIVNGLVREQLLECWIGSLALPISGLTLCCMIFVMAWLLLPQLEIASQLTYAIVGLLWMMLTVVFEFLFGYILLKASLEQLLAAYNITAGNLWLLVVLFIGAAPWLVAKLKGRI